MKRQFTTLFLTLTLIALGACSNSSNRTQNIPADNVSSLEASVDTTKISNLEAGASDIQSKPQDTFNIETPTSGARFKPGDTFTLSLVFSNFELLPPEGHNATGGHDSVDHSNHGSGMTDAHSMIREGHYHVYLDTEDDSADHVTQWIPRIDYTLPADIEQGEHYLRVNLRAPNHHALGIEARVSFIVE
ncbi:MAG: hypothetical protein AB8B81_20200 [Halioglobus sp.]